MVVGTQASGALVLATAHQAQRRAYGASAAGTPPGSAGSAVHAASVFFTILKQGWDFYRFSRSLPTFFGAFTVLREKRRTFTLPPPYD